MGPIKLPGVSPPGYPHPPGAGLGDERRPRPASHRPPLRPPSSSGPGGGGTPRAPSARWPARIEEGGDPLPRRSSFPPGPRMARYSPCPSLQIRAGLLHSEIPMNRSGGSEGGTRIEKWGGRDDVGIGYFPAGAMRAPRGNGGYRAEGRHRRGRGGVHR